MPTPVMVAILSEDRMFREVLTALLADKPGIQVAGSASALEELEAVGLFDVMLVDAGNDARRALSRLRVVRDRRGEVKTVVLGLPPGGASTPQDDRAGGRGHIPPG